MGGVGGGGGSGGGVIDGVGGGCDGGNGVCGGDGGGVCSDGEAEAGAWKGGRKAGACRGRMGGSEGFGGGGEVHGCDGDWDLLLMVAMVMRERVVSVADGDGVICCGVEPT